MAMVGYEVVMAEDVMVIVGEVKAMVGDGGAEGVECRKN